MLMVGVLRRFAVHALADLLNTTHGGAGLVQRGTDLPTAGAGVATAAL